MSESITVVGSITEPELKVMTDGLHILNFRIGSKERRFDKDEGKWTDGPTSWYSVSAFRRLAEHGHRSFRKGDRVVVTGKLKVREWETESRKGVTAEIDADALGHDLLWGTTTFHRSDGHGLSTPADGWAVPGAPTDAEAGAETGAQEWVTTAPGAGSAEDGSAVNSAEPALAGAGTPF